MKILYGHSFEFIELESERLFFGGVMVYDYQAVVDRCAIMGRAEVWDMDRKLGAIGDAAAIVEHQEREEKEASQLQDYQSWRRG
jgi:hypothetical protein